MAADLSFDFDNGSIKIGHEVNLGPGARNSDVRSQLSLLLTGERDHGNGFAWLYLGGLTYGGAEAGLSLCFKDGELVESLWSVQLPGAEVEGGWPTKQAILNEIKFVHEVLAKHGCNLPPSGLKSYSWGSVYSVFDEKGFLAGNGLRFDPL